MAFQQMEYPVTLLQPSSISLFAFNQTETEALGEICLPVSTGEDEDEVTVNTSFFVLDVPAKFNAILGRNWIHAMKAVPSTLHQVIKFPGPNGIMELRGDQIEAHGCFAVPEVIPLPGRKKTKILPDSSLEQSVPKITLVDPVTASTKPLVITEVGASSKIPTAKVVVPKEKGKAIQQADPPILEK
jgi:hypothetical protein